MGRHSRKGRAGPAPDGEPPAGPRPRESAPRAPADPGLGPGVPGAAVPGPARERRRVPVERHPDEDHGRPADGATADGPGTPARGTPQARGGHPGPAGHPPHPDPPRTATAGPRYGDWVRGPGPGARPGRSGGPGTEGTTTTASAARPGTRAPGAAPPRLPGPRPEYLDAFAAPAESPPPGGPPADEAVRETARRGSPGRTFGGVAAAAVTTVLAVVVAGQMMGGHESRASRADAAGGGAARPTAAASTRARPVRAPAPTYDQLMAERFPLSPGLKGSGRFSAVPGSAKAPGTGRRYRYRVDIEDGLPLDGRLFADAVQKTLNDDRSWAHHGARTFERISSGTPDFVITLASPGTTDVWCAKSGLDTSEEHVSCDSAATQRVMINAYRWARGAATYGPGAMHAYRQMLINHEVGHRLGHDHVSCTTPGALAPVMQQQTKSLDINGIKCRANPWVYPEG
ncbi:DUF3152 domain-containing protein [Streptomyces sp. 8L]|nr:DUF3152 domain-containing protein [Streptomyces sp. 8L]MCA1222306.1 DUF3152 domain-containing protein [Streptomyces sp. 8L]